MSKIKNFGDFVRGELNKKNSGLKERIKFFKHFCSLIKARPESYRIRWYCGYCFYEVKSETTGEWSDVTYPSYHLNETWEFR